MSDPIPPQMPPQPPKKGMSTGCIIALCLLGPFILITVIAILASIAVPAYNGITKQAEQAKVMSNAKQVFLGMKVYAIDNDGNAPESFEALVDEYVMEEVFMDKDSNPIEFEMMIPAGSNLDSLPDSTVVLQVEGPSGPIEVFADGSAQNAQ